MKNSLRLVLLAACASAIPAFAGPSSVPPVAPPSVLALAGYEPLSGEGIVVTLSDRTVTVPLDATDVKASPGMPGLVHDYDVLDLVNQLRFVGARGITVGGVRLTNQSSIYSIGPRILVDKTPVPIPLRIEAVGNAALIKSHLEVPGGFISSAKRVGPKIQLRILPKLQLNAAPLPTRSNTHRP